MRKPLLLTGILATTAALLLVAAAGAATSANVSVSSTVNAGATLSVAGNGTPSFNLTLNGDDQTTSYTLPVEVVDARGLGSGGGWNLTVTSTQFGDGSGNTFPAAASTITAVTTGCAATSTCLLPTNGVAYSNFTLPAGSVAPTAVKYFSAASPTGRGRIDLNATVSVVVPANVLAGSYTSTVTVAISAGP